MPSRHNTMHIPNIINEKTSFVLTQHLFSEVGMTSSSIARTEPGIFFYTKHFHILDQFLH